MRDVTTLEELTAALDASRAVLFFDVEWSQFAARSRQAVGDLERAWREANVAVAVVFHRLDLTDPQGSLWFGVRDWLARQAGPVGGLAHGADGALVWVCGGKIADHVSFAGSVGPQELLERTRRAFAGGR